MNEVVAWATAPEPGGLPRAAGSCAGGMGGGVGSGSPPGCAHPKRTRATCGPWSTVAGAMAPPLSASGGHGNGQGVVAVTLRWLGPAGLVCAPPAWVGLGSCWDGGQHRAGLVAAVTVTLLGWWPPPCWGAAREPPWDGSSSWLGWGSPLCQGGARDLLGWDQQHLAGLGPRPLWGGVPDPVGWYLRPYWGGFHHPKQDAAHHPPHAPPAPCHASRVVPAPTTSCPRPPPPACPRRGAAEGAGV